MKRKNATCYVRGEGGALEPVEVTLVVAGSRCRGLAFGRYNPEGFYEFGVDYPLRRSVRFGKFGVDYGDGVEWYKASGTTTLKGWGKADGLAVVLDSPRPLIVPHSALGPAAVHNRISDLLLLGDIACGDGWRTHVESL